MTAVNENALCVTRDGEIFLGGTQGMISFHEMELNFTPKPYKIILSPPHCERNGNTSGR